jgi:ABC-type nitrate/sulfonate/bicarbonate transport system permease component
MSAESSAGPAPTRSGARSLASLDSLLTRSVLGVCGVLLAFGIWEMVVVLGILPEIDIPRASTVVGEIAHQIKVKSFWTAVAETARDAAIGLSIAILIGVPLGIFMGALETARRSLRPTTEFLRVVPGLAFVPLAALLWGQDPKSSILLVAFACLWPMLVQTMHGVQNVDSQAILTAKSFQIRRLALVRWVYLPGALPYVFTGLRICVALSIAIAVGAELIIGPPGLGTEIRIAQSSLLLPKMYSFVIASGLIGLIAVLVVDQLDRRLIRWPHKGRK